MWLFLGGCPRSGTTALMSVLNSNDRILMSGEENVFRVLKGFRKLFGTKEAREEVVSQSGMRVVSEREVFARGDVGKYNFSSDFALAQLKSLYSELASSVGKRRVKYYGDKLPDYAKVIGKVLAMDSSVKYIHITRNPFDAINSMLRRAEMSKQGKDWWKSYTEVDAMAEAWNFAFENVCGFEANKNVLHIQYEDLVFDEKKTMKSISDFLGFKVVNHYPLVSDSGKHHDRTYVTPEINERLRELLELEAYRRHLERIGSNALPLLEDR